MIKSRIRDLGGRLALAAVAAATVSVAAGATTVMAYGTPLACGARSEAAVFAPWADKFGYFRVSNGGFEAGATDWALSGGAAVVAGNETFQVAAPTDARNLVIPVGGAAESRTLCVSRGEDTIRLFVNNGHVSGAILHVVANVRNPTTGQVAQTAFDVNGDAAPAGWSPTMRLGIPNLLGGNGTEELTLNFTTRGTAATWHIDDVYVDPYKSY